MRTKTSQSFWQAISLGVLAGMRTTSAPLIISEILRKRPFKKRADSPLKFMQSDAAAIAFKIFAVGELVGDKLPFTPNRTEAGGVIGRCLSGGLAGATIFKANDCNLLAGALIGSSAAFAATFGSYYLRKEIVKKTTIEDPWIGALEDSFVITSGIAMVKMASPHRP